MIRPSFRSLAGALALVLGLAACDATAPEAAADLTEAEVAEATAILAEALAEDAGGLAASTRDLTASVAAAGMTAGPRGVRGHRGRGHRGRGLRPPCRARYELTYDEATGTHIVTYACSAETDFGHVRFGSELTYQFRDAAGGFVPEPAQAWETVDAVAFGGVSAGAIERARGGHSLTSTFEQMGEWALTALADDATPALLSGRQQRSGTRERTGPEGSGFRAFTLDLSGSGIELREGADGLGHAAVGELVYTLQMEVTRNGETQTRTVEGTIELEENGRALLRVFGIQGVYRISLGDGATDRAGDGAGDRPTT